MLHLETERLVTAATILQDVRVRSLEAIEVLGLLEPRLGVGAELGNLRLKLFRLLPDRRRGMGLTARLRILGEEGRQPVGLVDVGLKYVLRLGEVKWLCAADHCGG